MIADNALLQAIQGGEINKFINRLLEDLPRRLCMDKRKRLSLRSNVRKGQGYYNTLKNNELQEEIA